MVERGRTLCTAAARPDANGVGYAFHGIAESHIVVDDKAGKAQAVNWAFLGLVVGVIFVHDARLLALVSSSLLKKPWLWLI
jgi:hypothetical protein